MIDYLALSRRLPEAKLQERINIKMTCAGQMVLSLDDSAMEQCHKLTLVRYYRNHVVYEMDVKTAFILLDDFEQRSYTEGGFDQPAHWYRIARANAKNLRAALVVTGYIF